MKCYLCDNKLRSRKRIHCQECIRAMQQIHDAHAHECKEKHARLGERIELYQERADRKTALFA